MSEWKESANRRRDERRTAVSVRAPAATKKNTKRWCRGVVGRAHQPECKKHKEFKNWYNYQCCVCGKVLDYYTPPTFGASAPKPGWLNI